MCRFSSLEMRASILSAIGSLVTLPVLRCDTRVASSWKDTYVTASGDHEVVAHRDAVPVLLRGPAADPGAPCAVAAEPGGDLPVVRREVVLGEQVRDHRCLGSLGQPALLGRPVLAAEELEVAALAPRDVVVGVPLLG